MAGYPADYVDDWTDSEDEIVFSDDILNERLPAAPHPPSPDFTRLPPPLQLAVPPQNGVGDAATEQEPDANLESVSPELQGDFRVAVTKDNVELARKLLAKGAKVSMRSRAQWSALVQACCNSSVEMVQLLVDYGADVNFLQGMVTPLMAACGSGQGSEEAVLKCVKVLLDKGAEPNFNDGESVTALMLAAREGYCKVIELLMERGANLTSVDSQGWTALCWAAYGGQGRVARFLLKKLPDDLLALVALDGQMPSDIAHSRGFHTLARILVRFEEEFEKRGRAAALDMDTPSSWSVAVFNRKCKEAYGDVALVLAAIEQLKLLPLFQKHNVGFEEMLTLDNEALRKMGVDSEEDRIKVLTGIDSVRRFRVGPVSAAGGEDVESEMESFLSALELVNLSGTLREHGVATLDALLRLDEEGLERAGVSEVGTQRLLAAAIRRAHQLPWHRSSAGELPRGQAITCADAVTVVSVLREHLVHLESSATHLRQHLRQRPQDLQLERDVSSVRHLREELCGAIKGLHTLGAALLDLDDIVTRVEDNPDYLPHWPPPESRKKRWRWSVWVPVCLGVSLWLYKSSGRIGYWALLPRVGSFSH